MKKQYLFQKLLPKHTQDDITDGPEQNTETGRFPLYRAETRREYKELIDCIALRIFAKYDITMEQAREIVCDSSIFEALRTEKGSEILRRSIENLTDEVEMEHYCVYSLPGEFDERPRSLLDV